jgi:pentose-5-phosphate-3-epimerase
MSWPDWIRTVEIEPALSAADPLRLDGQVESLLRSGCRLFHVDVAEGDYGLIESLAPLVHRYDGVLDVHLAGQASALEAIQRGADSVTIDAGAQDAAPASLVAREHGRGFGVLFPPLLGPEWVPLDPGALDVVCLSVDDSAASLLRVREIAAGLPATICLQVEGAVGHDTVGPLHKAGARVLVVGGPLFEREDLPRTYRRLVQALA